MNSSGQPEFNAGGKPPRLKRRGGIPLGAIWPLALVLVLAAAWSSYWYAGSAGAKEGFRRWQARQAEMGRNFTCGERRHGGFPFRFEMYCGDPRFEITHDGMTTIVRAKAVNTVSMAYLPNRVIAEFVGPLYIERDDGAVIESTWDTSRMSMHVTPLGENARPEISRADLETANPLINIIPQPGRTAAAYRAESFQMHLRKSETAGYENGYDLALSSVKPELQFADGRVNGADNVGFIGGVSHARALYSGDWKQRLSDWRDAGGMLRVDALRVASGDALGVLDGALRLDREGRPEGRVNLTTAGLDVSKAAGEGGIGLPGLAAFSIGALGSPVEIEGRQASRLGLRLQDGTLFLGPLGLTRVPSLTGQ
ncbi:MAG: DUF2125 domain-containing protein [Tepidamorphaceae bacterium]